MRNGELWTEKQTDLLTMLWRLGWTAGAISKDEGIGKSRNAVIGKVHRLGLAARPSPIKRKVAA